MHLVYVTAAMPFSLDETYIVPEILELQKRQHQVTVIPLRPLRPVFHEDARALSTIAHPVLSLSIVGNALAEIVRAPTLALRSALLLARSRNVRVLLKNLAVFPKGLWLARVARREGVDHFHAHFASTSATVALIASIVSGIPWSFTAHRWDISENNLLDMKAQAAVFARAIDARGGQELTTYVGAHQQKVRVIHMGVAVPPPSPEREEWPRGPLRVLLGARFDEEKGHRYALEAVARLKGAGVNVSLHCAGHGPLKATIKKYAGALDVLDRVHFPGLLDHQELLTQLWNHRWDVALLPSIETSKDWEGIPVFLIEAMAAGVPVVATKTGGIPELLEGGVGMLIPQRDAGAIAEALAKLAANGELRRQLAEAGIRRVHDQFTIESTVSALLEEISSGTQSGGAQDRRVR
jgi:colanic acid/amylovoran biosynthesis glycosyltransferase